MCTNGSKDIRAFHKVYELVDNITYSMHFEHITLKLEEYKNKALVLEDWKNKWNQNNDTGWEKAQHNQTIYCKIYGSIWF